MKTVAILPAAGIGKRMGASTHKQLMLLNGKPIVHYALHVLSMCELVESIVLMVHPEDVDVLTQDERIQDAFPKVIAVLPGGNERQDTVYQALEYLSKMNPTPNTVIIHDGVRPLLSEECLRNVIHESLLNRAAIAAVPITDTVKETDSTKRRIKRTLNRDCLWAAQTPQCFTFEDIWKAHRTARSADYQGTDDAELVERLGIDVALVPGTYENIKITSPFDMKLAESILAARGGKTW